MAGNYPDYPGNRIAYNQDGTQGFMYREGESIIAMAGATMNTMNNESADSVDMEDLVDGAGGTTQDIRWGFLFPSPVDLSGFFLGNSSAGVGSIINQGFYYSLDTTNGVDGAWTYVTDWTSLGTSPAYRSSITTFATIASVKGVRWQFQRTTGITNWIITAAHLFGRQTASGDRLELWHPTLDERIGAAHFDWGNAPQASSATRDFRVKNRSTTLTANSITVSLVDSTDSSPSFTDAHDLSNGGAYATTQDIGSLAAGAISSVLTLRSSFSPTQPLGTWAARLQAQASSWT